MRFQSYLYTLILSITFALPFVTCAQPCATATKLTPALVCNSTTGSLQNSNLVGAPGTCGTVPAGTAAYGVWYYFTATSTNPTITVSGLGINLTASTTYVELLTGTCSSSSTLTSVICQNVSTQLNTSNLTVGATYYIRVYIYTASNPGNKTGFSICVTGPPPPPANDDCANAVTLTSSGTCSTTSGTLNGALASTGIPAGCQSGTHYDVWYTFKATNNTEYITLGSLGANITNPEIQLFQGSCGSLVSLACASNDTLVATSLKSNATYYVRVSNVGADPTGTGTVANFNICVTTPTAGVEYSKSYINLTKGTTGGTVDPGDTLEMRLTFVVSNTSADSLAFFDTLYNGRGLRLVPNSLSLRTNEDILYRSVSDATGDDEGYAARIGTTLDTAIRINFGVGATVTGRGKLAYNSRPSVFNNTCIVMVTYKVVVYAPYNTKINFKSGALTYRDPFYNVVNNITFPGDSLIVYQSPGLCPNAISVSNAIGVESNGTFGTATGSNPLSQNRSPSSYTSYIYAPFNSSGGPGDYFYGIANNTSQNFSTVTTWPKPDGSPSHRVFGVWDITGDHTGASNLSKGNPPCDTSKPASPTNPCGYMLVINSAYRTDTAFTYTVTNLCPNTYYEISAWFKNMCYKCSCDSTGQGATSSTFKPAITGDSTGVKPNIAFDVNGTDYYTTGDIKYTGTTPTGSDATNQWVKRGFTYLTGPSETSFTLTLRNNAPGGGGNDWAMDDINVSTCLPDMKYSPSLNPVVCASSTIEIKDTIQSYFNNYVNYKWQRSIDGGSTWADLSGTSGTATPAKNAAGAWEYITSYTVPSGDATTANNGDKYRVIVATASGNINNNNCQITDGVSTIQLNVTNCSPLNVQLLSFNGKLANNYPTLTWTTVHEDQTVSFDLERSWDGRTFNRVNTINGYHHTNAEINSYSLTDSIPVNNKIWYRIILNNKNGIKTYSHVVQLSNQVEANALTNITNPFRKELPFEININQDATVEVTLLSLSGNSVKKQTFKAYTGKNSFSIQNTEGLANGVYMLQIQFKGNTFVKKVIKI